MFQKLKDFYTQAVRIDLAPASRLSAINPENIGYRADAERGAVIVSVLQGDIHESVYTMLMERTFETYAEACSFCQHLALEHPDATCIDFVTDPSGASTSFKTWCTGDDD